MGGTSAGTLGGCFGGWEGRGGRGGGLALDTFVSCWTWRRDISRCVFIVGGVERFLVWLGLEVWILVKSLGLKDGSCVFL